MLVRHRITGRVALKNDKNQFLLMLTHWDPGSGLPPRWVTPGGGIDDGETPAAAAVRELFEETGLTIAESDLGAYLGSTEFRQDWVTGDHETGVAHFYALNAPVDFTLDKSGWTKDEHRDVLDFRWFTIDEIESQALRVGPPDLVQILRRAI